MENTESTESIEAGALQRIIAEEVGAVLAPMACRILEEVASEIAGIEALKRRPLLTPLEVQKLYGIKATTLSDKRTRGGGPDYIKEASSVFYRPQDVDKWIERNKRMGGYER